MKNYVEIFWQFLLLGLTSFGGPMAHLGYFRKTFVEKLGWLDDESYAKIVALCQFLPGPSSSQVGFSIGMKKGGVAGGVIAFVAFTLPSFLILYFLATLEIKQIDNQTIVGIISGLKLFAVVIVADATFGMFNSFCKTKLAFSIFILCALTLLFFQTFFIQILVIALAGCLGATFVKSEPKSEPQHYIQPSIPLLLLFFGILFFGIALSHHNELIELFISYYQMGGLIFGGGHVLLPLIAHNTPVDESSFLMGYAFAQAMPGPMFTIATYLGAITIENNPFAGALVATLGIFLPGFLLLLAFEKSFESYSKKPIIKSALLGINASVVAIIFAALCDPIIPSAITSWGDALLVLGAFVVIRKYKVHVVYLLCLFCLLGVAKSL